MLFWRYEKKLSSMYPPSYNSGGNSTCPIQWLLTDVLQGCIGRCCFPKSPRWELNPNKIFTGDFTYPYDKGIARHNSFDLIVKGLDRCLCLKSGQREIELSSSFRQNDIIPLYDARNL